MMGSKTTFLLQYQIIYLDDHAIYLIWVGVSFVFPVFDKMMYFCNIPAERFFIFWYFETQFAEHINSCYVRM